MSWSSLFWATPAAFLASAANCTTLKCLSDILHGPENLILFVSTCCVIIVLLTGAFFARRGLAVVSEGWSALCELIYDFIDDMSVSFIGHRGHRYTPFALSVFLFVLFCNWSGLLPVPAFSGSVNAHNHYHIFEAPSASYNTTLALAIVSVLAFTFFGIKQRICGDPKDEVFPETSGAGEEREEGRGLIKGFWVWLTHYLGITPVLYRQLEGIMRFALVPLLGILFCFLNVIEELARLLSLSFRLYGNIYGEHMVKANLMDTAAQFLDKALAQGAAAADMIMGFTLPVALVGVSLFVTCLGALAGGIQAMVFCMLTLSYIGHIVAED
ncbi:F0F1 ATP synthase subunit A [bacterium]|nr:F0F1 ATP synthase subunit A [bacterium]